MKQYFNDGQTYALLMSPRDLVAICGRGFGKGVLQAERMKECMQFMPGSSGGMVGPSVKRLLSNILPSAIQHWENWGYKRDVHWVIGHAPPKKWGWKHPIITPESWDNTVSFYNGSVIRLISQDRSGTSNSLSLDWLSIDEAKFIDFEQLKNETFQANRGQEAYFGKCWLHHGMTVTSDMSLTRAGSWFLKYEKECDAELVKLVEGLVYRRWELRQRIKDGIGSLSYNEKELKYIERNLQAFRKKLLIYKEYTSIENMQILGLDYIKQMKRDLPLLTFMTSIMCKRIDIATDGFYSGMKKENEYTAPELSFIDNLEYDSEKMKKPDSRWDSDIDPDKPIIIGFDPNANINWLVAAQVGECEGSSMLLGFKRPCVRIVKSFFTKYERKLPEVVEDFCEYFRYHHRKKVIFYYDQTLVGNNYALHNDDFHHAIIKELKSHGWSVKDVYLGKNMGHIEKQLLINRMFNGRAKYKVLINRDNNEDLLISIKSAGVYNGKKDKRAEKLAETETDRLEARTDGSDAFDTVCIGVEKFPVAQSTGITVVSSMGGK